MTQINVQDTSNIARGVFVLSVCMVACRRDVLAYVAKQYPSLHIVSFA